MQAELAAAQDAVSGAEKSKSNFERQLRDMQGRLEEAEAAGGKNLKNQIRKLEQRVSRVTFSSLARSSLFLSLV